MRRRYMIVAAGATAVAWPLDVRAQQESKPIIGYLSAFSQLAEFPTAQFRQGLADAGYVEGRNVAFEQRYADGQYDRLPAMAADLVERRVAGGLISYTSNPAMEYERAVYVGRILNGEKPADLPVQQPTKFELIVNLKTAKALGLTVPQSIVARADEVIE